MESLPKLETYYHPGVVATHIGLKVALLVTYLLCGLFNSGGFVLNFVLVALLMSADFWYVKNVSGRKLVGLRYWNYTNEAGENEWQFESRDAEGMARLQPEEKRLFWVTLYMMPSIWVLFALVSLIKLSLGYLLLCLMGTVLGLTNVTGFTKSSNEAKAALSAGMTSIITSNLTGGFSNMFGRAGAAAR